MNFTDDNNYGGIMFADMLSIALDAHNRQTDKSGNPYFEHVMRVATPFLKAAKVDYAIVSLGHDLAEQTWVTLGFLEDRFPEYIVEAIDALTQREDETYRQYVKRLCRNDIAREVKKFDIKDNLRPERMYKGAPIERYYRALGWIHEYELTGKIN